MGKTRKILFLILFLHLPTVFADFDGKLRFFYQPRGVSVPLNLQEGFRTYQVPKFLTAEDFAPDAVFLTVASGKFADDYQKPFASDASVNHLFDIILPFGPEEASAVTRRLSGAVLSAIEKQKISGEGWSFEKELNESIFVAASNLALEFTVAAALLKKRFSPKEHVILVGVNFSYVTADGKPHKREIDLLIYHLASQKIVAAIEVKSRNEPKDAEEAHEQIRVLQDLVKAGQETCPRSF